MFSDLIVGFDSTAPARDALALARRLSLATGAGADLRLITVPEVPSMCAGWAGYVTTVDAMRDVAADTLQRAADAADADADADADAVGRELTVERALADGPVVDGVTRHSQGADLLVIGSPRYGRLRRLALGTHTGPILHAASTPVLVVPRRASEQRDDAVVRLAAGGAA